MRRSRLAIALGCALLTAGALFAQTRVRVAMVSPEHPATYLIDQSGRIAATYVGIVDPSDLAGKIEQLPSESK